MAKLGKIFWPAERRQDVGIIGRFGRVVHWSASAIAALLALCTLLIALGSYSSDYGYLLLLVFAAGFFFAGRAARYIFSAE